MLGKKLKNVLIKTEAKINNTWGPKRWLKSMSTATCGKAPAKLPLSTEGTLWNLLKPINIDTLIWQGQAKLTLYLQNRHKYLEIKFKVR